ncbi:unnamed protein product [Linum trigynum]|uniref:Chlorophyll a-b binding protein, chloroplastic n=1 Tax=Linum trigynum TaxID=586398 RepID=A0AAV2CVT5_9ROSI
MASRNPYVPPSGGGNDDHPQRRCDPHRAADFWRCHHWFHYQTRGGWGPLILAELGFDMPTTTPIQGRGHPPLNAGQVSVPWLVTHIQNEVEINDETPEDQVERYARIYLIGLVGGFLFPDKSNRWIQGIWMPLLTGDLDAIGGKELGISRVS